MGTPNITVLTALVLAQDAAYHTRSAPVLEQIYNWVWEHYTDNVNTEVPWTFPVTDIAGLGAAIYAAFVAAGVTSATGGVAFWLEQLGNQVLTYPYTRASNNVLNVPV
jgi:hypothetical protein